MPPPEEKIAPMNRKARRTILNMPSDPRETKNYAVYKRKKFKSVDNHATQKPPLERKPVLGYTERKRQKRQLKSKGGE